MVPKDELCDDMEAVAEANPLSAITVATLTEDYALVTDLGEWKRLKCSRPTRSTKSAISDREWDEAQIKFEPSGSGRPKVDVGQDTAWKWDTTAIQPLHCGPKFKVLLAPRILVPPRDGTTLHPDAI